VTTYDFLATDDDGNTALCEATVTILDRTSPQILISAQAYNAECNGSGNVSELLGWLNNHGDAIATDACGDLTWTNNYRALTKECGNTGYSSVTFTVTDACGNSSTTEAIFSINDSTSPRWEKSPQNLTLECDGTNDPYQRIASWLGQAGGGEAEDSCSLIQYNHNFTGLVNGCGGFTGEALVTFTATDDCGNTSTQTAWVSIIDRTAPVIQIMARDTIVECDGLGNVTELAAWLNNHGGARATDQCGGNLTWAYSLVGTQDGCGLTGKFRYAFTATDACGNISAVTEAIFEVQYTKAPIFDQMPSDTIVQCDGAGNEGALDGWLADYAGLVITNTCSPIKEITYDLVKEVAKCGSSVDYLYRFTVVDSCGNSSTADATFSVVDTTGPVFTGGLDSGIEECIAPPAGNYPEFDYWLTTHAGATASDVCGSFEWTNNYNPSNWITQCGNTKYVDVTFTATDLCGNQTSLTKRFSIGDLTPPVFLNCPRPPVIEYAPDGWDSSFVNYAAVQATDNCSTVIINQIDSSGLSSGSLFPVGLTTLIYEAIDYCGNRAICEFQVIVNDYHTPPTMQCPSSLVVNTDPGKCGAVVSGINPFNIQDNSVNNLSLIYDVTNGSQYQTSGYLDASGTFFGKGISQVRYKLQDQPLLLISEVVNDGLNHAIEITNFGAASYNISYLSITSISSLGAENTVVPPGTILLPGETYVHTFAPQLAGTPAAYYIWFINNLIDGVAMNGYIPVQFPWSGQINGHHALRTRVLDSNSAADFILANDCSKGTMGQFNTELPVPANNGKSTSLQSEPPSSDVCTFTIEVRDQENPYCAAFDTITIAGPAVSILQDQCIRSEIEVAGYFNVADVNIIGLQGTYPSMGGITAVLTSPSGTKVTLFSGMCNTSADFDLNLDDEAVANLSAAPCNPLGNGQTFKPLERLKSFFGEPANGTWSLELYSSNDLSGLLNEWQLQLSGLISYPQTDVLIDNLSSVSYSQFTWDHARVGDNCCDGTVRVDYTTNDGIPVPLSGVLAGLGGQQTTQNFHVGTTYVTYTVTDASGNISTCSFDVVVTDNEAPVILSGCQPAIISLAPGECRYPFVYPDIIATDNVGVTSITFNPDPGHQFEIGETTVTCTVSDAAGNTAVCTYTVTILEHIPFSNQLTCNDEVNLSLGKECVAWLNADMFLEGDDYRCYEKYCIVIKDIQGNIVGSSLLETHYFDLDDVGKSYFVSVCTSCDLSSANCCWTKVNVEEKLIPEVVCPQDVTIQCNESTNPVVTGEPEIRSCEPNINITFVDKYIDGKKCGTPRAITERLWIIEDETGNEINCHQLISVMPFNVNMVEFPDDIVLDSALDCEGVSNDKTLILPSHTGYPTINGKSIYGEHLCEFNVGFRDEILDDANCPNGYEILRYWTIRDECNPLQEGVNPRRHIQSIKVEDHSAPVIVACPDDITVHTNPYDCSGTYSLENANDIFQDACGPLKSILVSVQGGSASKIGSGYDYLLRNMEVGNHLVKVRAIDQCRNMAVCTFTVTVEDKIAPNVVAKGEVIIALSTSTSGFGRAKMYAASVDDGSFDNCGPVKLEIRRNESGLLCGDERNSTFNNGDPLLHAGDHPQDDDNGEFVTFCCDDLVTGEDVDGDGVIDTGYHKVILRVWDDGDKDGQFGSEGDQYNEAWTVVKVQNKVPPILTCPSNITLSCAQDMEWLDQPVFASSLDLSLTGNVRAIGICGDLDVLVSDLVQLNQCGQGIVMRTFTVETDGFVRKCTQTITMSEDKGQQPWQVKAPSSNPVSVGCDGPSEEQLRVFGPTWTGGPCDLIGINTDVQTYDFEGATCRKWVVKYDLINWCNNELKGPYFAYFVFNDEQAPVLTACKDTSYQANAGCEAKRLEIKKAAIDTALCSTSGEIYWKASLDIHSDGITDFEWSSFLPQGDDVLDALNENPADITDDDQNGIKDIWVGPTESGNEVVLQLPVSITAGLQRHTITWQVFDGCKNQRVCVESFNIYDQKKPTPVCHALSTALMADPDGTGPLGPMVEISARIFNNKSWDNCTDTTNLVFTFNNASPANRDTLIQGTIANRAVSHYFDELGPLLVYPGNVANSQHKLIIDAYIAGKEVRTGGGIVQLWQPSQNSSSIIWTDRVIQPGTGKGEVDVIMTVWDESDNSDFCLTSLVISCPGCPGTVFTSISGQVLAENGKPVKGVEVFVNSSLPEYPKSTTTDQDGKYAFNVIGGFKYALSANQDGDDREGVSTLDLVLIQQHLLGISKLSNHWKIIAADASNNERVTAADLTEIRKLILGIYNEFPNTPSWRFPAAGQWLDPTNPFPFVEWHEVENVPLSVDSMDFVAIKVGDVNGSASVFLNGEQVEKRTSNVLRLSTPDKEVRPGELIEVPFTVEDLFEMHGMQMTIQLHHASFRGILPGLADIQEANVATHSNNKVTLSYVGTNALSMKPGDVLFTLLLSPESATILNKMIEINSSITEAEAYTDQLEVASIEWINREREQPGFALYQNEPNPFKTATTIAFELPENLEVALEIHDASGQLLLKRKMEGKVGINQIQLKRDELSTTGILFYTIIAGQNSATRKCILIE
jgi:hypothetical protein